MVGVQSYEGSDREGVRRSRPPLEQRPLGLAWVQAAQKEHCVGVVGILMDRPSAEVSWAVLTQ